MEICQMIKMPQSTKRKRWASSRMNSWKPQAIVLKQVINKSMQILKITKILKKTTTFLFKSKKVTHMS